MTTARQERSYLVRQTAGKITGEQAIMPVPRCLGSDRTRPDFPQRRLTLPLPWLTFLLIVGA